MSSQPDYQALYEEAKQNYLAVGRELRKAKAVGEECARQLAVAHTQLEVAQRALVAANQLIFKWDEQNYSTAGLNDEVLELSAALAALRRAAQAAE